MLSTSLPMANVSGHSKKVSLNCLYYFAYCIGNIIGPQVFRSSDAPSYSHGYAVSLKPSCPWIWAPSLINTSLQGLLACLVIATVTILGYGYVCYLDNAKRDREQQQPHPQDSTVDEAYAFSDLTDKEKRDFRYTY